MVTTPTRKEYLVALKNFSQESHTGEMLAGEISKVIEKIGVSKFAAIVTDSAANCKVARRLTSSNYPHIWDIRCAAHAVNLIAADLTKVNKIKDFIKKCNMIIRFFHNSHQGNAYLKQGLTNMKIKSEGLQTWIKTRWGSLFMTTDSLLRARPVFDWVKIFISFEKGFLLIFSLIYLFFQRYCLIIQTLYPILKFFLYYKMKTFFLLAVIFELFGDQ
jgi:hypothetical protein